MGAWTTLGSGSAIDLEKKPILAKKIIFSDEAHFNLGGYVNKLILSHVEHRKLTQPKRVNNCCGFCSKAITGPFFFENKQGEAVTVNGDRYRIMLNEFLFTKIEEENIGNIWFHLDGATWHTAEATLDVLSPVFEDCIISRRANIGWSPRSCDLTPLVPSKISVTPTSQIQLTL